MPVVSLKEDSVPLGNVERAAEIFAEYGDFILAVIRYQVNNDDLSEDLFQDFFLSLASKPLPAGIKNVKSYLYRAITNDIVDAARRVENYQTLLHKYACNLDFSINKSKPENALIDIEQINKLVGIIKGWLPHSEAQAMTLRYKYNHSIEEVAEKMNVSKRSVSRYLSAGLSKVRQILKIRQGN
ncbi:MAG: RNA polymerase sigma factor [Planctomycetota bacterium]|jgi:RNA polymerase sigma factor (sigma-70 family)